MNNFFFSGIYRVSATVAAAENYILAIILNFSVECAGSFQNDT